MTFTRTLRYGISGDDVVAAKNRLLELGYYADHITTLTRKTFGADTVEAVRRFQTQMGLTVDGIVGKYTWAALFNESATTPPATAVEIPARFSAALRAAIGADLATVSEVRRAICLDALNFAIDPLEPAAYPLAFYIRGANLYDKDLSLHRMTQARLTSYFNQSQYAPYFDGGRGEMMLEAAKATGYAQPGADCSGMIVGLWRKHKIVGTGFDATANALYGNYCVPTSKPIPGDVAWRSGHIGLYVGGGRVVEFVGGAFGCQLTVKSKRQVRNFVTGKLQGYSAWSAFGDPKKY